MPGLTRTFEFKIGEEKRGFCFSPEAADRLEAAVKLPLYEIVRRLSDDTSPKMRLTLKLFYEMAVQYSRVKSRKVDFTINDIGEWITELGNRRVSAWLIEGLKPLLLRRRQTAN